MDEKPNTPQEQPSFLNWLGFTHTPDFRKARWLGPILGALLAVFVAILFAGAGWAAFRTLWIGGDSHAANAAAGGLGAGALIVAVLGAPFLFWRTWIAQQTQRFQKEGHITDRITKAVEQLGVEKTVKVERQASPAKRAASTEKKSAREAKDFIERTVPNIEVRIGAILALERMSQDSMRYDNGRDHVRIMEILCAYIRHNAPAEAGGAVYEGEKTRDAIETWAKTLKPPRADIAMALTVLGRRDDAQRAKEGQWPHPSGKQGYHLDLRGTCLQRADLSHGHFEKAFFWGARLEGANLEQAHLGGAYLGEAHLEGAALWGAHLERATLMRAHLEGAALLGAHLERAALWRAQLEGANLSGAHLERATLREAHLEGADLREAHLERATLLYAHLEGANLSGAHLEGADLREAHLEGADLEQAHLEGADLVSVNLEGANLRGMHLERARLAWAQLERANLDYAYLQKTDLSECYNLTQAQIERAFGDGSVTLPEGIERPAHWPQGKLDDRQFGEQYELWRKNPKAYTPPAPTEPDADTAPQPAH